MKSETKINRRRFLKASTWTIAGIGSAVAVGGLIYNNASSALQSGQKTGDFEVSLTATEWKKILTPGQYAVLREDSTERKYSSALLKEKRKGKFHCAGCDLAVYSSNTKYDSKTGWPSFWNALPGAIRTKEDSSLFISRTEVHCRRCGGHFGHIFDDGPMPTGKRHCLNGLALTFTAA